MKGQRTTLRLFILRWIFLVLTHSWFLCFRGEWSEWVSTCYDSHLPSIAEPVIIQGCQALASLPSERFSFFITSILRKEPVFLMLRLSQGRERSSLLSLRFKDIRNMNGIHYAT